MASYLFHRGTTPLPSEIRKSRTGNIPSSQRLCIHDSLLWLLAWFLAISTGAAATENPATSSPPPLPLAVLTANASRCRVSEFACANNKCIPINHFCDAANDCGDASDEPRHCSRCNRTYYGDIGRTYELELHRPREDRLPYICLLTLTAAGGIHGDLVQVTLDSFTLGRFVSFTVDGCPDGYLQIAESGRPQVGGSWCGTSWGPAIYYSETVSITIVVRLLRLSKDQNNYNFDFRMEYKVLKKDLSSVRYGGIFPAVANNPSHIGRSYVGNASRGDSPDTLPPSAKSREYYLGDLISGTYCSRIFSDCDRKLCRLQSPNFPGVYPRNLTCYYAVRQHEVPAGKHALIRVRQPNGQLVSIRSQSALYAPAAQQQRTGFRRELKVWSECDEVQDYVTIYDGYTTRDPVVLKFCGGGEPVPPAVSSGPELLVEFTTSPFGTFLHPTPLQSLHGFQLEVEVVFVDQQSPTYAKNKRACEFWIRGTGSGVLEHPQHSLPPNTTCLYHMQGIDTSISVSPGPIRSMSYPWRRPGFPYPSPRFRVWFSVLKFHVTNSLNPNLPEEEFCASHLNIWDGPMRISPGCSDIFCDAEKWKQVSRTTGPQSVLVGRPPSNATLVARYCRERAPRTCEHALLAAARPCARAESFLSRGDSLTLELKVTQSTAIKPVSFKALYEFVDLHQDGQPHGGGPCSRRFRAPTEEDTPAAVARRFTAPKDVFLYGRGGARNLSCQYRFEAKRGERVKLTISRLWTGGHSCATRESEQTARLRCLGRAAAVLRIAERPWGDAPRPSLPRDCLCDDKLLPFTYVSSSRLLELHFTVLGMNATDDFRRFFFEASYEFIRTPVCERPRRMTGPSGEIKFRSPNQIPDEMNCEHHPWLIDPSAGRYLYIQVRGTLMKEPNVDYKMTSNNISVMPEPRYNCLTRNRIAVYAGGLVPVVICPQPPHEMRNEVVEVFSEGWSVGNKLDQHLVLPVPKLDEFNLDKPRTVIIEYIGREIGSYSITWLELMKMKPSRFTAVFAMSEICKYKCPELDACINASLWCDGIEHCPSGQDESLTHCSAFLQLPAQYLALIFALIICIACLTVLAALKFFKRRRTSVLQQRLKSLSSDTGMFDEKEVIC